MAALGILSRISTLARERPRLFGGTVAGTMGGLGDIAAQKIAMNGAEGNEHSSSHPAEETVQLQRAGAMSSFCCLCASVVYVPFYSWLDRVFGPGRSLLQVAQKTAANQLGLSPFFDLPLYFAWTGFLDGYTAEAGWERFRVQYRDTLFGTWAVWIPVCILNFSVIPLHFRVAVAYTGEFAWSCVVSWLSHRPIENSAASGSKDASAAAGSS
jgi:protein Mpv17